MTGAIESDGTAPSVCFVLPHLTMSLFAERRFSAPAPEAAEDVQGGDLFWWTSSAKLQHPAVN